MRKFWRIGSKKKIEKLEEEFIDWSNSLDEDLFEFKVKDYSIDCLTEKYYFYLGSLTEVKELDYEYKSFFIGCEESTPNYEKLFERLSGLLKRAENELARRKLENY